MARSPAILHLTVALVAFTVSLTAAQTPSGGIPECATKLASCVNYLNATTTPPSTCCGPLKEAVTKQQKCLCGIYNNPILFQTFNINVTQALNLISLCHVDSVKDPQNFCKALAPSSLPPSSSGSTPKPSGDAATTTSSPNSAAAKFTRIGLVSILLVVGAYTIFY